MMSRLRPYLVPFIVSVLFVACVLALFRPRCSSPSSVLRSAISNLTSGLVGGAPRSSTPVSGPSSSVSHPLFGTGNDLLITVPPSRDTVRIIVNDKLHVVAVPESSVSVLRRSPLIRFHPTLHACALLNCSTFQSSNLRGWAFGLKARVVEVGRFGLTGYVTNKGPGAGLDCRLVGNLSADVACIWRVDSFKPLPGPLSPTLFLGFSIRL